MGGQRECGVLRLELPRGLLTQIVERIPCLAGLVEEFLNSNDCSSDIVGGELLHFTKWDSHGRASATQGSGYGGGSSFLVASRNPENISSSQ